MNRLIVMSVKKMKDRLLRDRINRIRDALKIITEEINAIYNDNAECKEREEAKRLIKQIEKKVKENKKHIKRMCGER